MNSEKLRSRSARLLIAAALLMSVALSVTFIAMHRVYDLRGPAVEEPRNPITDDQAMQQVLGSARQLVGAGKLKAATGSYILVSCAAEDVAPYQGSAYLNFDTPSITQTPAYFREIARSLTARGWTEGLAPGHHPGGHTLFKDGVAVVYYRHPDIPGRGAMQIYGECRDMTDHRADTTGFTDITGRLYR
jgi:hypothetical protein